MEENIRAAVNRAMSRNIEFLAKGLKGDGFPFIDEKMVSWSDWMAEQVIQELRRGPAITTSNTEE
tara:strand:+ start:649 stop:843 length:195 start_codon:yes stop_codon:yes gene_type:complete